MVKYEIEDEKQFWERGALGKKTKRSKEAKKEF